MTTTHIMTVKMCDVDKNETHAFEKGVARPDNGTDDAAAATEWLALL